jgi:hypothetical protein
MAILHHKGNGGTLWPRPKKKTLQARRGGVLRKDNSVLKIHQMISFVRKIMAIQRRRGPRFQKRPQRTVPM